MISKEIIGRRIANLRKTSQMTQAELSEKIDISEKYLSRIECGKQLPSIVIIARICETLQISADEILLLSQAKSHINSKDIHNEIASFSKYEQYQIIEIIKIIKEIKNYT